MKFSDGAAGLWIPLSVTLAAISVVLLGVLDFNDGMLVYALDDPYIGFALAEEIARGNYGINPGESSSPGSTILWPLLMVPLIGTALATWVPLLLNTAIALVLIGTLHQALWRWFDAEGCVHVRTLALSGAVGGIALFNLVAIVFTGMEHPLQCLLALIVCIGLIEATRRPDESIGKGVLAALILGPLIRPEAIAITATSLPFLWALGRRRDAAVVAGGAGGLLLLTGVFLALQGLGPIPMSVALKAPWLTGDAPRSGALANLYGSFQLRQGFLMALTAVPLLAALADRGRSWADRGVALWVLAIVLLHFLFGRFLWFDRYEAYVWTILLPSLFYLYRTSLAAWIDRSGALPGGLTLAFALLITAWPYLRNVVETPLATNDVYAEQYQLHRFVTEHHRGPVGVNDIGWVAFRNDDYVLDLYGLSSSSALQARLASAPGDLTWMDRLTSEAGVKVVMIYEGWFGGVPQGWVPLGRLELLRLKAFASDRVVDFYATRPEYAPALRRELQAFAPSLPEGSQFVFYQAP